MVGTKSKIFIAAVGLILALFGFLFKKFYSAEKFKDQFELDHIDHLLMLRKTDN